MRLLACLHSGFCPCKIPTYLCAFSSVYDLKKEVIIALKMIGIKASFLVIGHSVDEAKVF
jgi:hypothetical protein